MTSTATATHAWRIAEQEYQRHEARGGRRYAYERIDPARTALVVVDMVRFFADSSPYVRGIIPRINEVAHALRAASGLVTWVVPRSDAPTPWQVGFYGERVATMYAASGGAGEPTDRLASQLAVADDDPIVEKSAPSALFPGRSKLPDILRSRDVATVVVAGTVSR